LLAKSQVLKQQVAASAKNTDKEDNSRPQQAQHEISIIRGQTKLGHICQLFDLNADRYFGESQPRSGSVSIVSIASIMRSSPSSRES
jgi:hypothetical protein